MAPAIGRHHAEWLSLVETSGPFLSVPVLSKALPQGLDAPDRDVSARLRSARDQLDDDSTLHRTWCEFVLREVLELDEALATGAQIPAGQEHRAAEHGDTVRPDLVALDHGDGAARPALHVTIHEPKQRLDRRIADAGWSASPIDRIAALCRATDVQLGLTTNGQSWALVFARRGETTGVCTWDADLWLEEPITLRAFRTLLGAHRFFSVPAEEMLPALLEQSARNQQEVTDRLGAQVRQAVELLIDALDRADHDRKGELLGEIPNQELYRAAVTMMMRLVFLFVAEERRLLPLDDPLYAESYAASTLREQLEERATRFGEDPLERSSAAWYRLLALSRGVHGGIDHEALRLPAYGGSLFDPDRYPFLEGRNAGTDWRNDPAAPLPVDDRTVLHLLSALQVLSEPGRGGQPPTSVRLSFRALDVEQIGHVYEGLLDHTAVRTFDAALGLVGSLEAEVSLTRLENARAEGDEQLVALLKDETGKSPAAITKALAATPDPDRVAKLLAVCDNDPELRDRVLLFLGVVRDDLRDNPRVFLPGALYVTSAGDRRASGTYYTPRSLAEEVVQHTLDPVAYSPGPAEERDPAKWKLKSPEELLDLNVADIAMGSGAFLVAACRYLAARLLEAWNEEIVPGPDVPTHAPPYPSADAARPVDPLERDVLAHRLVAERCLYGVDRNPMAVEMAKLSLWLVTLAKDRPFSFLDHALREGDSLLGVTSLDQVKALHMDPVRGRALHARLRPIAPDVDAAIDQALALRDELEAFVVRDVRDAQRKTNLHAQATAALGNARLLADVVVGAALANGDGTDLDDALTSVESQVAAALDRAASSESRARALQALADASQRWLQSGRIDIAVDRRCFHWALELPEVWRRGGFDAIVGNPPFLHGSKLTGSGGLDYREHLVRWVTEKRGNCDLAVFFLLRAVAGLRPGGICGLVATNSIAEGDSREVGLDQLEDRRYTIFRAVSSMKWPGGANLQVALVWLSRERFATALLDGQVVSRITTQLRGASRVTGRPSRIASAVGGAFNGPKIDSGFFIDPDEAHALLADDRYATVVRPRINGKELTELWEPVARKYVIDFRDWPLERAEGFPRALKIVRDRVKPTRDKDNRKARKERWWQFAEVAPGARRVLDANPTCAAVALTSATTVPTRLFEGFLPTHAVGIFSEANGATLGVLTSTVHQIWAVERGSTMRVDPRYTITDCYETFVPPTASVEIDREGKALELLLNAVMRDRAEGLTRLYQRVHDRTDTSVDIQRLRDLQVKLDVAVATSYGWSDLDLGHGFHETRQGVRFTFEPVAHQEVLDLLLELNLARHAAGTADGLRKKKPTSRKPTVSSSATQTTMFGDD